MGANFKKAFKKAYFFIVIFKFIGEADTITIHFSLLLFH